MANPKKSDNQFGPLNLSFLTNGYYDKDDNLRPELLDQHARDLGKRFAEEKEPIPNSRSTKQVSSGQIRRFFGDVRDLEERIGRSTLFAIFESSDANEIKPYLALIRMLKSKADYAAGRGTVTTAFKEFITHSVDQIKTPKDFRAFVLFFEAIVGYYYGAGGEKNR
jgi:CRISPR-associated protein Csm2